MQLFRRYSVATASALGLLVLAGACTDRKDPISPLPPGGGEGPPTGTPAEPITLMAIECTATVRNPRVTCGPADPSTEGPSANKIVIGGWEEFVKLNTSNYNYNAGTGAYTFDATMRNLIPQAIGTTNGVALDPGGVRIFFHQSPTATAGTGNITVNADGTGAFTGQDQPYYQYNSVLDPYELSPARQWHFTVPSTVTAFNFTVYVSAAVQYPQGWIETEPAVFSLQAKSTKELRAIVRNAFGVPLDPDDGADVEWVSLDSMFATVEDLGYVEGSNAIPGTFRALVTGVRAGGVTIAAADSPRAGSTSFNITGVKRLWQGGHPGSETNWYTRKNWEDNVIPASVDTAVFPVARPSYPLLNQNTTIGGIIMEDGVGTAPTLDLGSFDLNVNASIASGPVGTFTGTGRVLLLGTAQTLSGSFLDFRNLRVQGTYSLENNLSVTGGRIVVQGGRLRSTYFRIRVRPN